MRIASQESNLERLAFIQGLLVGLSPLPFVLFDVAAGNYQYPKWFAIIPYLAFAVNLFTVFYPYRKWRNRRLFGTIGVVITSSVLYPMLPERPDITLAVLVLLAVAHFSLFEQNVFAHYARRVSRFDRYNISLKSGVLSFSALQAIIVLNDWDIGLPSMAISSLTFSAILVAVIFLVVGKPVFRLSTVLLNVGWALVLVVSIIVHPDSYTLSYILLTVFLVSLPTQKRDGNIGGWLEYAVAKPARALVSMFLAAGFIGSVLLYLPVSQTGPISWLDTFFTAISAVCVTGLIVVDTPMAYTFWGQLIILILIQLGGLGIMSVSIILLQRLGKRISISQEQVVVSMTDADKRDIYKSIRLILAFTIAAELLGAVLLSTMFFRAGDELGYAVWRGLFTSVSAFCNAGFALQSDSLMAYAGNSGILTVVSLLIILGGISPLYTMMIMRRKSFKTLNAGLKLTLYVVLALIVLGTMSILVFEWNGTLGSMAYGDKIMNAWFQSATLRTAGFNSVDQALLSTPAYLMSLVWMVIGGSPGGTAGGIKTAVVGLILLNFISQINQKQSLTFAGRVFPTGSLLQAASIVTAYGFVLSIVLLAMLLTQNIPIDALLFEVISALSTVGLSMGATSMVDPLGKWILIFTMFIGRVGAVTIFMLLSKESQTDHMEYPEEQLTLA
jgi:trk system potassium uptake protein